MDISKIDKNFAPSHFNPNDYEWHEITEDEFSLHGVYHSEKSNCYIRMPEETAKATSDGVAWLNKMTAGGRVRFATNDSHIAIQAAIPTFEVMSHMASTGSHNFGVYVDGEFSGTTKFYLLDFYNAILNGKNTFFFDDLRPINPHGDGFREIEITFPLYGGVRKLLIGVKKGCVVRKAKPYKYQKPIIFYGSSITQGGCASHAGAEHVGAVCRRLDSDYINLGFSGSAKAEETMREYLASLDPSVFVLDYDHNAPSAEHLRLTHYPLYEKIRSAHRNTPIVFITKPDFDSDANSPERRAVIYETYRKAKENGDENVWFIDGETLFGKLSRSDCTVDTCHPNDLGFYKMTNKIYPVVKQALLKAYK